MHGRVLPESTQHGSGHRARLRQRLFEGGERAVYDHVIVGASGRTSMRAMGLI